MLVAGVEASQSVISGEDAALPRPWPCPRGKTWTVHAGLAKCKHSCFQACEIVQRPGKKTLTPSVIYFFNQKLYARIPFPTYLYLHTHSHSYKQRLFYTMYLQGSSDDPILQIWKLRTRDPEKLSLMPKVRERERERERDGGGRGWETT